MNRMQIAEYRVPNAEPPVTAPRVRRRSIRNPQSAIRNPQFRSAFTLIEMLVVLGIIGLVVALSVPLLVPMMRTRKLDSAVDLLKSTCILAHSKAIQQRKMMCVTLLMQTDAAHGPGIVITDYDMLREAIIGLATGGTSSTITDSTQNWPLPNTAGSSIWNGNSLAGDIVGMYPYAGGASQTGLIASYTSNTITSAWSSSPVAGSLYIVPGAIVSSKAVSPFAAHWLGNYPNGNPDVRFLSLKFISGSMGENIRYLPEGCQFAFPATTNLASDPSPAWTYVFLPNGQAWTVPQNAADNYSSSIIGGVQYGPWYQTTYISNGVPAGPTIYGPENKTSAAIIVYATTGTVVSQ